MIYTPNIGIKRDRDWVTDYIFDFSSQLPDIGAAEVRSDSGLTVGVPVIVAGRRVRLRVSGGTVGVKYGVTVKATSIAGEVRTMRVIFLII